MKTLTYPEREDHLMEHSDFIAEISNIRESWDPKEYATMTVLKFLSRWLYNHILTIDKKLWKYIQEKAI
jgi:hemerythrin-like metal-binding protein